MALQRQVAALMARADAVDEEAGAEHGRDRRGDELPEELQRAEGRLAKIQAANAALEAQARGLRQFLRRGVERVAQEWSLICIAHNLLKLRAVWKTT